MDAGFCRSKRAFVDLTQQKTENIASSAYAAQHEYKTPKDCLFLLIPAQRMLHHMISLICGLGPQWLSNEQQGLNCSS